mmetsp:Transcript_95716/g.166234  ORF Transcript_95716/g.166234 Transcript_95716/m.166234 type:complete len:112 (+) Transcript_95716:62-397(+)
MGCNNSTAASRPRRAARDEEAVTQERFDADTARAIAQSLGQEDPGQDLDDIAQFMPGMGSPRTESQLQEFEEQQLAEALALSMADQDSNEQQNTPPAAHSEAANSPRLAQI